MKTFFRLFVVLASLIFTSVAFADPAPYTQSAFDGLQKAGKSILVEVHAPWCPSCRAQAPIVNELLKKKDYQAITVLRVDFDGQKDVLKAFNVSKQSTLIVFKGAKEVGRSTGDTNSTSIEALIQKAI